MPNTPVYHTFPFINCGFPGCSSCGLVNVMSDGSDDVFMSVTNDKLSFNLHLIAQVICILTNYLTPALNLLEIGNG